MEQFLKDMRSTKDYQSFVTADIRFHRAIAAATKNPFLGLFTSFVDMRLKEASRSRSSLDLLVDRKDIARRAQQHLRLHPGAEPRPFQRGNARPPDQRFAPLRL